jgi:ParB family transcriptional regulator, chromosome partitioning protein
MVATSTSGGARRNGVASRERVYMEAVPIEQIVPDPNQPRTHFEEDDIASLSDSLSDTGFVTPLLVRRHETEPDKFMIIGGGRRWLGAMRAGIPTLPCLLVTSELTEEEVLSAQLDDNMHRKDLDPVDQARSFQRLMSLAGLTPAQLATKRKLTTKYVNNTLSLLQLLKEAQEMVIAGKIPVGVAYELAKIMDPEMQVELARQAASHRLTVDQVTAVIKRKTGKPAKHKSGPTRRAFAVGRGTRVNLISNKNLSPPEQVVALYAALQEILVDVESSPRKGQARITAELLGEIVAAFANTPHASLASVAAGALQRGGFFLLRELFAISTYQSDKNPKVNAQVQGEFLELLNKLSSEARLAFLPFKAEKPKGGKS